MHRTWISFSACSFSCSRHFCHVRLLAHLKDTCHVQCKLKTEPAWCKCPQPSNFGFNSWEKLTTHLPVLYQQGKSATQLQVCALALQIFVKRMCKWPLVSFPKDCISKKELLLEPLQCIYMYVSLKKTMLEDVKHLYQEFSLWGNKCLTVIISCARVILFIEPFLAILHFFILTFSTDIYRLIHL